MLFLFLLLGGAAFLVAREIGASSASAAAQVSNRSSDVDAGDRSDCGPPAYTSPAEGSTDTSLAAFFQSPPLDPSRKPKTIQASLSLDMDGVTSSQRDALVEAVKKVALQVACAGWNDAARDIAAFADWLAAIKYDSSGVIVEVPPPPSSYTGPTKATSSASSTSNASSEPASPATNPTEPSSPIKSSLPTIPDPAYSPTTSSPTSATDVTSASDVTAAPLSSINSTMKQDVFKG